ncbi:MAG: RluA family pseudouridine synthase [bacterium]
MPGHELTFIVPPTQAPIRVDKYLAAQIDTLSRARIQQLAEEGEIRLNGHPVSRSKEKVQPGDRIVIRLPAPNPMGVPPEPGELQILYEDDYFLAVNKPPGLCVHPSEHRKTGTLVNILLYHGKSLSSLGGPLRPGIVHRLDLATSGVLLVAKNDEIHRRLTAMFKARKIQKGYWAILHGVPARHEGEINLPIGRHPRDRKRMAIRPEGRPAVTRYRILRTGLGGSLAEVYPTTGRTHQIRVHFRHLGVPIVRDSLYGLKKYAGKGILERLFAEYPGLALHARSLRFPHPATGREITITVEPPDLFLSITEQMTCLETNSNAAWS